MRATTLFAAAATTIFVLATACSNENPASPRSAANPNFDKGGVPHAPHLLGAPVQASPLLRPASIQGHLSATKTIGVSGGTIELPGAGAVLVVPPLAVSHDVVFTVSAHPGRTYTYDFEPHGTTFAVPLIFTQSFQGVEGGVSALAATQLGYFADSTNPLTVSEVNDFTIDLDSLVGTSTIWHFSGYICMSGRSGGGW